MQTFKIHWVYVYALEGRDFVNASPLDQIELRIHMSKTIGDSTNFENDITSKRRFVKINLEYVSGQPCIWLIMNYLSVSHFSVQISKSHTTVS